MKEYLVSIDVTSDQMSLQEITELFGIEAGPDSRNKGSADALGRFYAQTEWKVNSELPNKALLTEHFAFPARRFDLAELRNRRLPEGARAFINIGVLYDSAYCSIEIGSDWLQTFASFGFGLNISCYPCEDDDEIWSPPDA